MIVPKMKIIQEKYKIITYKINWIIYINIEYTTYN
jgi:hypothetical protein